MDHDLTNELQRQATALRGLARDLLRDPHAADDVTQATLQQAFVHREGLRDGPIGGWLHRTLTNFARQWLRRERRHEARIASLPARPEVPATDEVLARRELLQGVTQAVLALDEPYQTAVFLRYFEDLPPRAIARRTGANIVTVKSRLARGLAMLRARLDTSCRGRARWRLALALHFGLPLAAPLVPLPVVTILVSTSSKALIAAAAVVAVSLYVRGLGGDPAPTMPTTTPVGVDVDNAASVADAALDDAGNRSRVEAAAAPSIDPWLDHPFTLGIDVFVVDAHGLPIANQTLELAPTGCTLNRALVATGPDGHAVMTWPARQRSAIVELQEPFGQLRRVQLQHGQPTRITVLGHSNTGGIRYVRGDATLTISTSGGGSYLLTEVPLVGNFFRKSGSPAMRPGLHPFALFGHNTVQADESSSDAHFSEITISKGSIRLLGENSERAFLGEREVAVEILAEATPQHAITGTVFGVDGKTVKEANVVLLGSDPQPLMRVQTDEQGRFRFDNVVAGKVTVRAGGNAAGLATMPAVVTSGTTQTTLHLQTGQCVRGRVVTADGKPRPKVNVQWRSLDGTWVDLERSGDDGAFTFANLPPGPGMLIAFAPDNDHRLPIGSVPSVLPDTQDVLVTCTADRSTLTFEPIVDATHSSPVGEARLWDVESGLGSVLRNNKEKSAVWNCPKIPPGHYELQLRTAFSGTVTRDSVWVDGKLPCDLGRIELPRHALVQIDLADVALPPEDQRAFEINVLRPDLDLRLETVQAPFPRPLQMPAGNYVFTFRHADGQLRHERFAAHAGETTTVRPTR